MKTHKEPLYRKVNSKARNNHHLIGKDAKNDRNTKIGISEKMKSDVHRGLDYTPLFRFLLSKVGKGWDNIYTEAFSRLDKSDPIFWMVQIESEHEHNSDYFCTSNSIWSCLIVDDNGLLQLKNPDLKNEDFVPDCGCCTYSFNGKVLNKKYKI